MKTRKILLNFDFVIQTLLLFLAVASAFVTLVSKGDFGILLGYALLLLGGWQLGSGAIVGLMLRDRKRAMYFFGSITYLVLIRIFGDLIPKLNDTINITLISIFIVIIPLCIAFWYLRLTKSTIIELEKNIEIPEDMRDVLDSEEIFKPLEKQ